MSHVTPPSCPFHEWRGCSGTISRRFQDHLRGLEGSTRLAGKQLQSQGEGNQLQTRQMQLQSDLHVGNPTFTSAIRPSRRLLPSREGKDLSAVNPRIVAKILDPHAWIIPIFQPLQSLKAAFCQRSSVLATADHLCFILLMGAHPRSCRRQQRADSSRIGSCLRGERTRLNASKMSRELWLTS